MLHRQSCLQASTCTPDLLDTLGSEIGFVFVCPKGVFAIKFPGTSVVEVPTSITHTIHVWYIYLHLVDFYDKCR